jgi:DNA (cytosine-5)-methyltransferase 1
MKRVIEITEPKIFIAENVKGLVNLSDVKEIIQNDFASANGNGYLVLEPQVLHSANYGVPQSRERIIFIGIKKSELTRKALKELSKKNISNDFNPYPPTTHKQGSFLKLKDVLSDIMEPELSNDLSQQSYSKAKFMGKHCQGQSEINLDKIGPTIRAEHHGNIEFRRLSIENGGKYNNELNSGKIERRLTVRECGLIQSFPPDFEFVVKSDEPRKKFLISPSQAYKVIGNAVPPLLAYHLAKRIENLWDKYFKE